MIGSTSLKKTTKKKTAKRAATATGRGGAKHVPLSSLTDAALNNYFANLNGHKPGDLYKLVMGEVEKPLFRAVLVYTKGNQCEAAEILGINRGTLRKKLKAYKLQGR